jgi:hypothetical protein
MGGRQPQIHPVMILPIKNPHRIFPRGHPLENRCFCPCELCRIGKGRLVLPTRGLISKRYGDVNWHWSA